MGESVGGPQLKSGVNAGGRAAAGGENLANADPEFFCDQAWSQSYIGTRDGQAGYGSVFGVTAFNAYYDANFKLADPSTWKVLPPNEGGLKMARPTWYAQSNPKFDAASRKPISGEFGGVQGFRGYSPGGVNMLFGDGSVRLVANAVDARAWAAMSTIVGREPIDREQ
jgi:prepilin-type processing-associated H-X9-DG protein